MNRKEKIEFAVDYIRFLINTQVGVDELYASVCYGGFVFDDTRIDLYEVFYKDDLFSQDLYKVIDECSSPIGDIREYLAERGEEDCLRDGEEVVCYIQIPADIWDALYGGSDGETTDYLKEMFEEFLYDREMDYELTTYGRNAVLIYKKEQ